MLCHPDTVLENNKKEPWGTLYLVFTIKPVESIFYGYNHRTLECIVYGYYVKI